jgi:hypothetical protein
MRPAPCVVAVAEHAGWAHVVCVAMAGGVPAVVERRRVTLIDAGLPTLPYHHDSIGMPEGEANALIARVRRSVEARSESALRRLATDIEPTHVLVALAIRQPPFPALPANVAEVWRSYRLQCAADGMLYQLAICGAARALGLDVHLCRRGEEPAQAAKRLGVSADDVDAFVAAHRPTGPPWTQEHRRAYTAGIDALAAHTRVRLDRRR